MLWEFFVFRFIYNKAKQKTDISVFTSEYSQLCDTLLTLSPNLSALKENFAMVYIRILPIILF